MRGRAVAAAVLAALASAAPAVADEAARSDRPVPSIVVEGEAIRQAAPDMAVVTVGVATERPSAQDASRVNSASMKAVLDSVKADGIADADVATTNVTITPVYDSPKNGDAARVRAFRAENTVSVKVRKLDSAGDLVGRLIDRGANTLQGIDFLLADPEPLRDELRAEAMRNARHRAEIYAGAIGLKLGPVLSIRPENTGLEPVPAMPMRLAAKAAPPVPLAAGTQALEAHVTVTWALEGQP